MQLKRLWDTLSFFEVIPFANCLNQLFNPSQDSITFRKTVMGLTLVCYDGSVQGRETLSSLREKGIPLRVLNTSNSLLDVDFSRENIEVINVNLEGDSLNPSILERVSRIICLPQRGIDKFISLVEKTLQKGEILLFDFHNQSAINQWGAVDDIVMGGISSSRLTWKDGVAVFTGEVSTENNGGFASVRSKNLNPPWDLSGYEGIRLRIRGDGQRYKFILRCEGKWDGIGYCYSFDSQANSWIDVDIPFRKLIPVFRAKTVASAGDFLSSQVYSFQLMLSKFEYDGKYNPFFRPGQFCLEIESIKAYGGHNSPQLILIGNTSQWQDYLSHTPTLDTVYGDIPIVS